MNGSVPEIIIYTFSSVKREITRPTFLNTATTRYLKNRWPQ